MTSCCVYMRRSGLPFAPLPPLRRLPLARHRFGEAPRGRRGPRGAGDRQDPPAAHAQRLLRPRLGHPRERRTGALRARPHRAPAPQGLRQLVHSARRPKYAEKHGVDSLAPDWDAIREIVEAGNSSIWALYTGICCYLVAPVIHVSHILAWLKEKVRP